MWLQCPKYFHKNNRNLQNYFYITQAICPVVFLLLTRASRFISTKSDIIGVLKYFNFIRMYFISIKSDCICKHRCTYLSNTYIPTQTFIICFCVVGSLVARKPLDRKHVYSEPEHFNFGGTYLQCQQGARLRCRGQRHDTLSQGRPK